MVSSTFHTVDKWIDETFAPAKPFVPLVARTLLVSTFIEDTIRIVFQSLCSFILIFILIYFYPCIA